MVTIENPAAGRYPIAALALALMLAGTLLPTPLFELYHRTWNLTPAEISLVFAVYAASLIPSLIFLGGLSDSIGRRRTILLAFAVLAVGSLIFAFADGLPWLIAARIVQGVGMGPVSYTHLLRQARVAKSSLKSTRIVVPASSSANARPSGSSRTARSYGPAWRKRTRSAANRSPL